MSLRNKKSAKKKFDTRNRKLSTRKGGMLQLFGTKKETPPTVVSD